MVLAEPDLSHRFMPTATVPLRIEEAQETARVWAATLSFGTNLTLLVSSLGTKNKSFV